MAVEAEGFFGVQPIGLRPGREVEMRARSARRSTRARGAQTTKTACSSSRSRSNAAANARLRMG
jgi:hypothetical protein